MNKLMPHLCGTRASPLPHTFPRQRATHAGGKKFSAKAPERLFKQIEARLPCACVSMLAGEMPVAALIARRRKPMRKSKLRRAEGEIKKKSGARAPLLPLLR